MTVEITQEEKNELTREFLDRLVYCKGYKEKIIELNKQFNPHNDVKYSYSSGKEPEFKFPIEVAIP